MKRVNTIIIFICALLIAANTFLIISLNSRLNSANSKLDGLEAQLAGMRSTISSMSSVQKTAAVKQKEIFTPSELAQYLGVSMDKIYDMIDMKGVGLPYVNIDGEYRFGKEAIDEWLKTNKNIDVSN